MYMFAYIYIPSWQRSSYASLPDEPNTLLGPLDQVRVDAIGLPTTRRRVGSPSASENNPIVVEQFNKYETDTNETKANYEATALTSPRPRRTFFIENLAIGLQSDVPTKPITPVRSDDVDL